MPTLLLALGSLFCLCSNGAGAAPAEAAAPAPSTVADPSGAAGGSSAALADGSEITTNYTEVHETFDDMNLREELLRYVRVDSTCGFVFGVERRSVRDHFASSRAVAVVASCCGHSCGFSLHPRTQLADNGLVLCFLSSYSSLFCT